MKNKDWPHIYQTPKNGRLSFCVDFGRINGQRERRFFSIKKDNLTPAQQAQAWAEARKKELRAFGETSLGMNSVGRADAEQALALLADTRATLTEAAKFYLAHVRPSGGSKLVQDVLEEMLKRKEVDGLRKSTLASYRMAGRLFSKDFGKAKIGEIASHQIEGWLDRFANNTTRDFYFRNLSILFRYALLKGYSSKDVLKQISRPKIEDAPVGILTVEQVDRLLKCALKKVRHKKLIPALAIGAFAGLRASEIAQLEWSEIDLENKTIEVKAIKAKTRQRRIVDISDNLLTWLRLFPQSTGQVIPDAYRERMDELKERAKINPWPRNCLRHSFASYHFAFHKDAAKTAFQLGHYDTTMLFKHYRQLVKPQIAAQYWKIIP